MKILWCFLCYLCYVSCTGEEFDTVACNVDTRPRVLNETNGVLTSPNYPGLYPINSLCQWRILSNSGDRILLAFTYFSLESGTNCPYDYVEVYDSHTEDSSKLLGRFCGVSLPPNVQSSSSDMFIKFRTDGSRNFRGFKAVYTADRACDQQQLPRHIYGPSAGTVSSPFHPENYVNNMRCAWLFHVHDNEFGIRIMGRLENCGNCNCDHVSLYDGSSNQAPRIAKLCGVIDFNYDTYSNNDMYMEFITDGSATYSGFNASYYIFPSSVTTEEPESPTPYYTELTTDSLITNTPSSVTPPELDVYVTGTFETPSQTNISDDCVRAYSEELRKKLSSMGNLLNMLLGQSLCLGYQFSITQTDLVYFTRDATLLYKGSTRLAFLLAGEESYSFGNYHSCSYEVSLYVSNHENWGRPLLSQLPGCPFLQFTPEMFAQSDKIWKCDP